jgi:23S rRNA pseudouridine1911/1915/1917 synthase
MQEFSLKVLAQDSGKRLDLFLAEFSQYKKLGFSRTLIQGLILEGKISLNGSTSLKPHHKIKKDDAIHIIIEDKKTHTLEPEDISLDIVYEDRDLAIIDKPSGLVVHPAPGNYEHTLVNALLHRFKGLSDINPQRPGIVHRLDKETSGLLVIAKNNATHLDLAKQFAKHSIKRKYIALVKGKVEFDEDVIELPIRRHPYKRKNMSVGFTEKAKYAKTYYRTLERKDDFSLLELEPFTGRTHQLRVHLAFLGHPILGDAKYGKNNEFPRLALHAKYLGFIHPRSAKFIEFYSDMPVEVREFLDKNRA